MSYFGLSTFSSEFNRPRVIFSPTKLDKRLSFSFSENYVKLNFFKEFFLYYAQSLYPIYNHSCIDLPFDQE